MLNSLEVLNGELMPNFDSYNMNYSVIIDEDVNTLELNAYSNLTDVFIIIEGNSNLSEGENLVTIKVQNKLEEMIYTLYVYKSLKKDESVAYFDDEMKALEIESPAKLPNYVAPLIGIICFIIIIFIFVLLFNKRKN